jgi:flagellar hook-associated protein 2
MAMIDGMISGMDTTSLIRQLMQLERQPVVRLQASKSAIDAKVTAYQALNTRFAAIGDAAKALTTATGWQAASATSTAPASLSATATPSAPGGSLTVQVQQLASAHSLASGAVVDGPDTEIVAPGTVMTITAGGEPAMVDLGDGSLSSVVTAINNAATGVRATAVKVGTDQYRLVLTSTTSGTGGAIELDPPDTFAAIGGMAEVTPALDAELQVGTGPGGFTVSSPTNTFTDVLPGVTLTAHSVSAEPVTVDVGTDHDAIADKVEKLVDAINDALGHIKTQSAYDAESNKAGVLTGDSTTRRLQQSLLSAVTGGGTMADLGIELTRDGTVTFDKEKFHAAHQANPAGVAERFTATGGLVEGFAKRLEAVATSATHASTGLLTTAIEGRKTAARQLERQIDSWEPRLVRREQALRRQFAGLEGALGNLQSQSNWLAGQLAGMFANSAAAR